MEFRKRARLEVINNTQVHNDNNNALSATDDIGTTLAAIGGQSYLFNSSSNTTATTTTTIPANILLTICDENSDESQEYLIDSSLLAHIKQEHTVATQTSPLPPVVSQQSLLTTSLQPQCRFLTQTHNNNNNHKTINNSSSSMLLNTSLNSVPAANLITNAVQLPTGCEIYLVKEYIDSTANSTTTSTINQNSETTTIKIEPDSRIIQTSAVGSGLQLMRQTNSTATVANRAQGINYISVTSNSSTSNTTAHEDPTKRSFILEAYKKRDDKRRATHNEVERRRRDKINSWIFKLKEMLPTDIRGIKEPQLKTNNGNNNNATRLLMQQQQIRQQTAQTTTRTPPSDSKSQILIKACEYIKAMQEEIKSLQKCLAENETLRLSNQRLQDELEHLRSNQFNNSSSTNVQLTAGVVVNGGDRAEKCVSAASVSHTNVANLLNHTITTAPALTTYADRDLIVREYND
uniref:BHLH domain-containing protein n=1 Tax=Glossina pallidipes TaxID=7398 RepID=A0A1A9ZIC4_GLOPL